MRVPWNDLQGDENRNDARLEALSVVKAAFETLADRLDRHIAGGYRADTRRALQIMKLESRKIVEEIDKELAKKVVIKP